MVGSEMMAREQIWEGEFESAYTGIDQGSPPRLSSILSVLHFSKTTVPPSHSQWRGHQCALQRAGPVELCAGGINSRVVFVPECQNVSMRCMLVVC